ncbi:MAG: hypothetical protein J6D28_01390 [Bacilli bacterium]|nr:hypothetical protein [Bacilli bacterium]
MELIYCFCLVAFILLAFGIYKILYYNYAKKNYSMVVGYIKDFEYVTSQYNTVKYPLIQYEVNGKIYKKRGWGRVIENKPWNVYYNPSNPFKCILEGDNGIFSIMVGVILLILPLIVFLKNQ